MVTINCAKKLGASSWKRKTVPLVEELLWTEEEDLNLYYELQKLPPTYREVIHLFYYEDMSIDHISRVLKRKHSTVRTQADPLPVQCMRNIMQEDDNV